MTAVPIDPNTAWKNGDKNSVRSRYSGYPLNDGEMVITILAWDSFTVGHSLIAFEWRNNPPGGTAFRCHRLFHLFPERAEEGQASGDPSTYVGLARISALRVPGTIARGASRPDTEPNRDLEDTSAHSVDPQPGKSKKTYYKSWVVDWDDGLAALEQARKDSKNPPAFNFLGGWGYNCAKWAQKIAAIAGIDSRSIFSKIGFAVPIYENWDGTLVKSEKDMWIEREKHSL